MYEAFAAMLDAALERLKRLIGPPAGGPKTFCMATLTVFPFSILKTMILCMITAIVALA